MAEVIRRSAQKSKEDEGKYEINEVPKEDLIWENSDISYINIALKTKKWVTSNVPTQADRDAYLHLKGRDIDEKFMVQAFAWFKKVSEYSDDEMKKWPEYHKDDPKD